MLSRQQHYFCFWEGSIGKEKKSRWLAVDWDGKSPVGSPLCWVLKKGIKSDVGSDLARVDDGVKSLISKVRRRPTIPIRKLSN